MGNGFKQRNDLIYQLGENFHKKKFLQKNISVNSSNNTNVSSENNSYLSQSNPINYEKSIGFIIIKYRKCNNNDKLFCFFISPNIIISHLANKITNQIQNIESITLNLLFNKNYYPISFKNIAIKKDLISIYLEKNIFEFYFGLTQMNENELLNDKILYVFGYDNKTREHDLIKITSLENKIEKLFIGSPIFYKDNITENIVIGIVNEKGNYRIFNNIDFDILLNYYDIFNDICHNRINNHVIKVLDCSYDNFMEYQLKYILNTISNLTHLNLTGTHFNKEMLGKLLECKFNNLIKLNLSNNEITDFGMELFSNCKMPLLDELNLDNNKITYNGLNSLIKSSLVLYQLSILSLSNNEIKDKGIYRFKNIKKKLQLEKLYISNIQISDLAIENIINIIPSIKYIEAFNNLIMDVMEKICYKKGIILIITKIKKNHINKSLYFEKNLVTEKLIKCANLFNPSFEIPESKAYKIYESNNELLNYQPLNNIDNIFSNNFKLNKLNNDYLYNCIQNLYVMFQDEKKEYIYTCFVINSNSIISYSEELINKVKKQGKNIYIRLTCSYPEIIKKYSLYFKKNYIQICFQNFVFKEWIGLKINSNYQNHIIFTLAIDNESNILNNKLYQINIQNETTFLQKFDENNLNKFQIGCPICIKDINDDIYSIGLIQSDMKKYYFTKNDIENLKYNILTNKIASFEFNIFDIEKNIIELRLIKCKLKDEDIHNLSSMDLINLTILNISYNTFTYKGCFYLSQMNLKKVLIFDISYNRIEDAGIYYLSRCNCDKLEELDLSNINITNNSIKYLIKAEFIPFLSRLNLQENFYIDDNGLKLMMNSGLFMNLKYFFLNGTNVSKSINQIEICKNRLINIII